ncbi:uncharacterized protein MKZ38_004951 [Zalerion maritima]|uniref:Methyltransferase n=1 Tax=Zalerion maritima TaxID=339359 RepID=A0AAD5RLC9_9PEZI|nr:uncharacterized protein MKZ38_004951 [Zalerion maritima]
MNLDGKLHIAPIVPEPKNVLDVATGTGVWAVEFAQENPGCAVVGTDLSPIQPSYAPPNVSFEIMDAEDEWTFTVKFDLVHLRAIVSCFKDTKAVFKSALESLAPGTGYMFVRDPLMPFKFFTPPPEGTALAEWNSCLVEASQKVGMPWNRSTNYAQWMREVGFVDVVEKREAAGLSPWMKGKRNKETSLLLQENICNGIEGMSMALFTRVLGWSKERLLEFLERVKNDLRNVDLHVFSEGLMVYGRRPYPDEEPCGPSS